MEMTTMMTSRIERCRKYKQIAEQCFGKNLPVLFYTEFNLHSGQFDAVALADNEALAQAVMAAYGPKIVSETLRREGYRSNPGWRKLSTYFTPENLRQNPVVAAESALLEALSYDLETGYYHALTLPPQTDPVERVLFFIAEDITEVKAVFQPKMAAAEKELAQAA